MLPASHAPRDVAKAAYDISLNLWRAYSPKGREVARKRAATDRLLDELARATPHAWAGTTLIDGMWDNPNFWLRFSLLRAALGLSRGREVGVLGQFRSQQCSDTFTRLGISELHRYFAIPVTDDIAAQARALAASARRPEDVLAWRLPEDFPAAMVYDGILKRQRLATVDVNHPQFEAHTAEALCAIARSRVLLDMTAPTLVVISHPFNFHYGSLAWTALSRGIPVLLAFGLFGGLRFARLRTPEDLFCFYDRPSRKEMDALPPARAGAMRQAGRNYLEGRLDGRADDLASLYAFRNRPGQIDRVRMCERFGWDDGKPIVAVYGSNWFDWPHQLGMTQFRDFLDWTEATLIAARRNTRVNWLFKPHPAEDWFGGVTFASMLALEGAPHIAISDKSWNNAAVMRSVDALVTYHGTAGIEFAALGKPVFVPDRGKYDDCGFVKVARSRDDYLQQLGCEWWSSIDSDDARRRAELFAGWWFCAPDWQDGFVLPDDSRQDALYDLIPGLVAGNRQTVAREVQTLHDWWAGGHPFYHTWKMAQADGYRLTNVR